MLGAAVPAAQSTHALAAAGAKVPLGQPWQAEAPVEATVPEAHGEQELLASAGA